MGLSGFVWVCLGLYGFVWVCPGLSWFVWVFLGLSGFFWVCLGLAVLRVLWMRVHAAIGMYLGEHAQTISGNFQGIVGSRAALAVLCVLTHMLKSIAGQIGE